MDTITRRDGELGEPYGLLDNFLQINSSLDGSTNPSVWVLRVVRILCWLAVSPAFATVHPTHHIQSLTSRNISVTITKVASHPPAQDEIKIESINWKGNVIHSETVEPYDGTDTKKACCCVCGCG